MREAVRRKGAPCGEAGLPDAAPADDQPLDAMLAHPTLVDRPAVVGPRGTRLARPSELVLEVPDNPVAEVTKEDGEVARVAPAPGGRAGPVASRALSSVARRPYLGATQR